MRNENYIKYTKLCIILKVRWKTGGRHHVIKHKCQRTKLIFDVSIYWRDAWKEMNSSRGGTQRTDNALRDFVFSDEYTCDTWCI